MKLKNRAQMEILGLAIVIVVILVGAMIYLRLSSAKKDVDYRRPFSSSQAASNMLNTFLDTTSRDCSKLTMTELLQDCAQSTAFICGNSGVPQNSCDYAESAANEIFGKTFGKWKTKYEFMACTNFDYKSVRCTPGSVLIESGIRCLGEKEFKLYPIPVTAGTIYVKLDICL